MENKWITVVVICMILFLLVIAFYATTVIKENKVICESGGGEYEFGQNRCYIKTDGVYEEYNIIEINGRRKLVRE